MSSINITPEAYRQAMASPFVSAGMAEMIRRRFSRRVAEFRRSAQGMSGWQPVGADTYSVPSPSGTYKVAMSQSLDDAGMIRGLLYQLTDPHGVNIIEASDDLEIPGDKVAGLLGGVIALCQPASPWGQMPLADVQARHSLAWDRRGLGYELESYGWSKTELGFAREIGGARPTPENPEGLRPIEVRLTEDLSRAELFFGDQKAAWVPLNRGSLLKNIHAIEDAASSMDFGYTRPEPDPLPDNFNPVQLLDYLYSRYAGRLGRIKTDHLYEVRTESWDGICALQTENLLAEVYIPSFTRDFPSGEVCGMYHRRQESGSEWAEKPPVICDLDLDESREALSRARRLGVELPGDEAFNSASIEQTVRKAKMAM